MLNDFPGQLRFFFKNIGLTPKCHDTNSCLELSIARPFHIKNYSISSLLGSEGGGSSLSPPLE